jgi:hypothetical protein
VSLLKFSSQGDTERSDGVLSTKYSRCQIPKRCLLSLPQQAHQDAPLVSTSVEIPAAVQASKQKLSTGKSDYRVLCTPTNLAGVSALLRDQERLDERRGRERDVPRRVPVGRADTVEQRRRLGQGAPRQKQGRRR